MGKYVKVMRYLVWLTQLGLSAAVPLVGFILLGSWLHNSRGWGLWVMIAGIVLGLLGAVGSLLNSFKLFERLLRSEEKKPPLGFNRHE